MKRFSLYLFIILLTFQTSSQADDIHDFQIEGMSIGDSLLDYFDRDLIINEINHPASFMYKNNEFVQVGAGNATGYSLRIDSNDYDDLSIVIKPNDDSYEIFSIGGRIFCKSINICKPKKKKIASELKILFGDNVIVRNVEKNHSGDPTGNSKNLSTFFNFKSGDYVQVSIYDWSKKLNDEKNWPDNLKVSIVGKKFRYFLENVQYK